MIRRVRVGLLVAFVAGCGKAAGPAAGGAAARGAMGPVLVEAVAARTDTVIDAITATGQIEAFQSIELRPEVDGRLVEIMAREGAEVAKGAALFKVDDGELKAQVDRAEADRDLAEQALSRTKTLLAEKAAAAADVERAEATARGARAALDLLALRLNRTVVRAPFDGVLGQRLASLGDYVNNSTRLITLQTFSPQRAVFQVPERYAEQLKVGQRVTFRVAALRDKVFAGIVDFVDPRVQLPARTITVKAVVPNQARALQSGMFIEVRLQTAVRPSATVIPEDAVLPSPTGTSVWVVKGDRAERRSVELGVRTPGYIEITSGIDPGDLVVVGGAERLSPTATVKATVIDRVPARVTEGRW